MERALASSSEPQYPAHPLLPLSGLLFGLLLLRSVPSHRHFGNIGQCFARADQRKFRIARATGEQVETDDQSLPALKLAQCLLKAGTSLRAN